MKSSARLRGAGCRSVFSGGIPTALRSAGPRFRCGRFKLWRRADQGDDFADILGGDIEAIRRQFELVRARSPLALSLNKVLISLGHGKSVQSIKRRLKSILYAVMGLL